MLLGALAVMVTAFSAVTGVAADKVPGPAESKVTYKVVRMDAYQNFLKNWDEEKQAVLYALIRTPAQYGALFNPAAVMGAHRPYAPEAKSFEKEQLLVVSRVVLSSGKREKIFEVERLVEKDHALVCSYRFTEPKNNSTSYEKNWLSLQIPQHDYAKVIFIENGKQVGELDTAKGQWAVPAVTPDKVDEEPAK
jgi:hypothetical protein